MTVLDIDHGWADFEKRINALSSTAHVLVGVQGGAGDAQHRDSEMTVAELASIHEFGLGVPERSFLRSTMDENEGALLRLAARLGQGVIDGAFTQPQALGLLGEHATGLVVEKIRSHIPPPNAPSTIAGKGSSTPLIDSAQLVQAITHEVRP